jgi:hypothetical protein
MTVRVKDWQKYQHYHDRQPPWIKLHKTLLDDSDYAALAPKAAKYLPLIWLLASESNDGSIPSLDKLSFRLRIGQSECESLLVSLSHWLIDDASKMLAPCSTDARLETEREGETEREVESPRGAPADDLSFIGELRKLYTWVNMDQELAKMKAWQLTPRGKGRKLTRRFMVAWLNKVDRPMTCGPTPARQPLNESRDLAVRHAVDKMEAVCRSEGRSSEAFSRVMSAMGTEYGRLGKNGKGQSVVAEAIEILEFRLSQKEGGK